MRGGEGEGGKYCHIIEILSEGMAEQPAGKNVIVST